MRKYLTKIATDVLPSVAATVIGAYIVNHYINAKPAADTSAAAVSSAAAQKTDPRAGANKLVKPKPVETAATPEPGVTAKGISEKTMMEKTAAERPAEVKPAEVKAPESKPAESKPTETASAPANQRRHQFLPQILPREKSVAKTAPASASAAVVANAPAPAAAVTPAPAASPAPPAEASAMSAEDHRDAAELARAAIERLRGTSDGASRPQETARPQEAARLPDPPRVQEPPRAVAVAPVRPLPPPITVAVRPADPAAPSSAPAYPPYTAAARTEDRYRLTPPADIPPPPAPPPLDLRADATASGPRDNAKNVAEDMLSAAKSVFHAVLPGQSNTD
jgi:hypothetical protein